MARAREYISEHNLTGARRLLQEAIGQCPENARAYNLIPND
ncbi:MAG TPA: hypothetical protein GXX25_10600 [Desulfotomaculum sp.]|nr:hypothetical protein [Desulfotomaculum sp.]